MSDIPGARAGIVSIALGIAGRREAGNKSRGRVDPSEQETTENGKKHYRLTWLNSLAGAVVRGFSGRPYQSAGPRLEPWSRSPIIKRLDLHRAADCR
jgi:hypothetical protein